MSNGKLVSIYTDGGCNNNGNNKQIPANMGAWAYVEYSNNDTVTVYAGRVPNSTNNRTEMMAIIMAIKSCDLGDKIRIYTDSGYVEKGWNDPNYLAKWMYNGWLTSRGKPIENKDLWEQLLQVRQAHNFQLILIKGHGKNHNKEHNKWNNIVDHACSWVMHNDESGTSYALIYDATAIRPTILTANEIYRGR